MREFWYVPKHPFLSLSLTFSRFPQRLLEEMEGLLGCWRGLLLPLTSDPELSVQAKHLQKTLAAWGAQTSEEMLKVLLPHAFPCIS